MHHSPPARHAAPAPNPVDNPYADYEERLDRKPPKHARYRPPRRLPRRRLVGVVVGAIAYFRWLTVLSIVFVSSGILATVYPAHALPIFTVSNAVAVLVAAGFQWRAG